MARALLVFRTRDVNCPPYTSVPHETASDVRFRPVESIRRAMRMTLSAHTLTLVALIAIGLSLLAIGFVVFAGGAGAPRPASVLTGDHPVGAPLGKIHRLEA